jgi:mannose PTS system EIIA component
MIGIVIVTHGQLAEEFRLAFVHVVGPQEQVIAINIGAEDDMELRRADILEACKACNTGDGVLILTDMFGGTPSNLAISMMRPGEVDVIAGVNLPMLVRLAELRNKRKPLAEVVLAAQDAGRKYISVASIVLAGEP